MDYFTQPLTKEQIKAHINGEGRLVVNAGIDFNELACISQDGTYDGLNEWVDENICTIGCLSDLNYRAVGIDPAQDLVIFEIDADASDVVDDFYEEDFGPLRQAAIEVTGNDEIPDEEIQAAIDRWQGYTTEKLIRRLKKKEAVFETLGGRGVELADEIDSLRIAIACRNAQAK